MVTNDALISADILPGASGNGGNIEIFATDLFVANSSLISADIFSGANGNAGDIDISATDSINLSNSDIRTIISQGSTGDGGNLNIETGSLILTDASQIGVSTLGNGNAGNLSIIATESIDLSGADEVNQFRSGLFAKAIVGNGNAGNLSVVTNQLNITDGATIEAGNFPSFETSDSQPGTGEPGKINIEANSINGT